MTNPGSAPRTSPRPTVDEQLVHAWQVLFAETLPADASLLRAHPGLAALGDFLVCHAAAERQGVCLARHQACWRCPLGYASNSEEGDALVVWHPMLGSIVLPQPVAGLAFPLPAEVCATVAGLLRQQAGGSRPGGGGLQGGLHD